MVLGQVPNEKKPIIRKWMFKKKINEKGKVNKYKAHLVEKG